MSRAHLLVVDDEADIRELVRDILSDEDYSVSVAEHAEAARQARRQARHDAVLLDVWMPGTDGISLLKEWAGEGLDIPVVMMSGHGTIETAVEATRLGAYDFIEKPLSLAKLLLTVERALESSRLRAENQGLKRRISSTLEPLGGSKAMQHLREAAERAAGTDAPVLLTGEPGTGKETLARWIHARSSRRAGPFVEVAAASLARDTAAAQLFGSEEGERLRYGLLERAGGGTLFIDDLADLDAESQGKLAAALGTRQFTRVGGSTAVPLDLRVVGASSVDLAGRMAEGRFREDLYYAIRVLPLTLPALRERPEDLPELLGALVEHHASRDRLPFRRFTIAAQNRLRLHPWHGNLRELGNLVQRLLILGSGPEIDAPEADAALGPVAPRLVGDSQSLALDLSLPLREAREQFEREYLLHQLKLAQGSVGRMAKVVGLERTHLYRKLRALGVDPKDAE
ncbi:MAG: sigma-54 dependent transcriptional regulator [Xanthomonadales bacterium]|jgi:DNA-binding NtrC family response regulator|nr:sigma-54 dependent transcriptional regulator [Xanthomonadales bacterium]